MMRTAVMKFMIALMVLSLTGVTPALAKKPAHAGNDKSEKQSAKEAQKGSSGHKQQTGDRQGDYFGEQDRKFIHGYYSEQYRAGNCPPGLAKKNNGCMPPGQIKKWKHGHPLPPDVIIYDLPPYILDHLGPPPSGHRFVRVAQDILLIAVGTGMVIDAIEDIGRQIDP